MISQYNRQFNSVYAIWQLTINQLLEGTSDTSYILYNMMIIVCCPVSGPYQYPATELNISALKCKFWRVCSLRNSCRRPRSAQCVNFSWLILTLLALFNIINNKPAKSIRLIFSPIQINWWIFTAWAAKCLSFQVQVWAKGEWNNFKLAKSKSQLRARPSSAIFVLLFCHS